MYASFFCDNCGAALAQTITICSACGCPVILSGGTIVSATQTPAAPAPAGPPSPAPISPCVLPVGFLLARRYQILQTLGEGGFATVYKARDRAQHRMVVAIKQIHLETLGLQAMLDATDAYNREVNYLSLLRNKYLPRIYAHFMDEQHWYIVIEYIAGKTLEERLKSSRHGFLPVMQVLDIGIALCDALQYLHMQLPPLIFRDVKPANIILTPASKPYLIDFGTTRLYRPGWKDTGPLGTPGYAAPEQYGRGAHTTPQTDIYGLGVTLQTLLTGEDPLEILQHGIPPARAKHIPQNLQDVLIHMQARDATKRPRNMAEVKKVLQEIKAQSPVEKIKTAVTFTRELVGGTSIFAYMALILLVLVNIAAFVGMVWPPLWIVSLLTVLSFTVMSGIFKVHEASQEIQATLSTGEKISIVWKQLATSLSIALLISMLLYYFFYMLSLFNSSPDDTYIETNLITLGIIAGGCIAVCLFWLFKWLAAILAAHKRASQQKPKILLQQKIRQHH